MKEFIVYDEGSAVLALGQIEGHVTQILIENGGIQYGVAWVSGVDVKSGMFNEHEVSLREEDGAEKVRIGFNAGSAE